MPGRLDGLENLIWTDYLDEKAVWVLNDAHAALIAEAKFGIGQGIKNIVMLTWGTGVGGGVLINGELYQGNYQMAGHLGHMILDVYNEDPGIVGMPGTLENAIGDATVSKRSFGRIQSTHELVKAYRQGDSFATYIWLNTVRQLALGLCSLCNLLSPELIILGGGVTKAGDALYKPLADFIDVYEWKNTGKKTPIKQAGYGEMAGAAGAAGFAFDKVALVS
jgi:glucokinase